jgi:hypothetical protein
MVHLVGVREYELDALAGFQLKAREIVFQSGDGFDRNLSIDLFLCLCK